ncbi:hypothetical protein E4T66_02485 [Sinimarinibacterium sp. CAU 1509]|uniref:hypothetical protein n=1 Tax=Sinimarinibacterium sp. CAU 1509 TaxID=2562283 RepID=UPI0010AD7D2A|nr:hypothetical protein [Sinimarinibacterium sp. CAU 1509]TJY65111.1 hypothetical protein E4T66_02485 [Sinimarinibacterium sp. CAU 1509]
MRRTLPKLLLLTLALFMGQWLQAVHDVTHPTLATDVHCQICMHAPGIDGGAVGSRPVALAPPATHEAPVAGEFVLPQNLRRTTPHNRGPPATFV